jgi:N-acetyl-anhydromuramyl-L-alanine amidase AmpD
MAPRILPQIDPADPQDRGSRKNTPVDLVVLHTTEGGSIAGAVAWWDREDVVASSHYLIDGKRVVQRVAEGEAAFHCGNSAYARRSIGIEVVGHAARPETWSAAVLEQLAQLCADIAERHGLAIDRAHFIGHVEVPCPKAGCPGKWGGASHHHDPGPHLPWGALLARVRELVAPPLTPAPVPEPKIDEGRTP